jgi:hypothetical protein
MPDKVDVEAPNRRPSVVVVVLLVSLTREYHPLDDSGVSLRSRPTAFRPDDTEIPESSDREPGWEYDDELVLQTCTHTQTTLLFLHSSSLTRFNYVTPTGHHVTYYQQKKHSKLSAILPDAVLMNYLTKVVKQVMEATHQTPP